MASRTSSGSVRWRLLIALCWMIVGIGGLSTAEARPCFKAASGDGNNPYEKLILESYSAPRGPFEEDKLPISNAWGYATKAADLVGLAFVIGCDQSPYFGRPDLVSYAIAEIEWLINSNRKGRWWDRQVEKGDPNVDRFVLASLLESLSWMVNLPAGQLIASRNKEKILGAVELQEQAYLSGDSYAWGGARGGRYVNQDAQYLLILALTARIYLSPSHLTQAKNVLGEIERSLLPDGAFHYIGNESESPVYHAMDVLAIGRYFQLTGDLNALRILTRASEYWLYVLTDEGESEFWSDVWWKQPWSPVSLEGLVVSAAVAKNSTVRWIVDRVFNGGRKLNSGQAGVYASLWWDELPSGRAPEGNYLKVDRNIDGVHGRNGNWYYGFTQGHGYRNTFVGGVLEGVDPRDHFSAILRGVNVSVNDASRNGTEYWLSGPNDVSSLAVVPNGAAALCVTYKPYPSVINSGADSMVGPFDAKVTQLWYTAGEGLAGSIFVDRQRSSQGPLTTIRILLGRGAVAKVLENEWKNGSLRVRFFGRIGNVSIKALRNNPPPYIGVEWSGLEVNVAPLQVGERSVEYLGVWIGPENSPVPSGITPDYLTPGMEIEWSGVTREAIYLSGEGTAPLDLAKRFNGRASATIGDRQNYSRDRIQAGGSEIGLVRGGDCVLAEIVNRRAF